MDEKDNDLLRRLQSAFKIEAEERLKAMTSGLLELEKASTAEEQTEIIETTFREAHSLKGAAHAANMTDIETICHSLESVFDAMKRQEISPPPEPFDALHYAMDIVGKLLSSPEGIHTSQISEIVQQLARLEVGEHESEIQPRLRRDVPPEDDAPQSREVVQQHPPEIRNPEEEKLEGTEEEGTVVMTREDDFLRGLMEELLATFKIEAEEYLQAMTSGLLELEKGPTAEEQTEIIETVFRAAHSLKGAARVVNLTDIESICQSLESVFSALKHEEISPPPELFDTFHHAINIVSELLSSPEGAQVTQISKIVQQLALLETGEHESRIQSEDDASRSQKDVQQHSPEIHSPKEEKLEKVEKSPVVSTPEVDDSTPQGYQLDKQKPAMPETVRISTAKLDSLLLQAEEMLSVKLMTSQRTINIRGINDMLDLWKKEWAKVYPDVRVLRQLLEKKDKQNPSLKQGIQDTPLQSENPSLKQGIQDARLQSGKAGHPRSLRTPYFSRGPDIRDFPDKYLAKLLEFLDWHHTNVELLESKLTVLAKSAEQDYRSFSGMVDNLLKDMKKVLMLPFSSLLGIFPKMVRDLSRDKGKEVDLVLKGGEIEIDKRILEEMKDPLIHLVRNCIDHGIEEPEVRELKNKPQRGAITIAISQVDSSKVEILVSNDGAEINLAKVKDVAVKRGIISEEEGAKLNKQETLSLIFQSDISTSPIVTNISGRGLGLAIVRERVEKLGGLILPVESASHIGTSFRMLLPVTLATFRGILVRVADQDFVIPTSNVEQVSRVNQDEIKTVENKETIILGERAVSFVRLDDVLELPRKEEKDEGSEFIPVLVLGAAEKRIAFSVDEVLDEQEVLVKSLGKQLSRVRNIAGATILGSGKVVPILNVSDLMKSAVKTTVVPAKAAVAVEEVDSERKSILVAEDSITSRTLLKNILESAGYHVQTTVDGTDAFTALRTEYFDLVVSDVDMPRLNGFDLTSKIRSDKKLSELPVVLVTSLESREDKERGIDVGANAYIVKSSFDQSNLLEVIRRLI